MRIYSKKKEDELIKQSLKYSTKDGIAATICGSAGDNFISPFAVALKASNLQIGLLSALPNLLPTELFTSKLMEKFSRKSIVTFGVLLQVLIWPLIALLGLLVMEKPSLAPILLIILYMVYIAVGLFMGPAWASWMKDITENIKLGKYFGLRNKIFGIVGLITIIIGGIVLDFFKGIGYVFLGFIILFLTASISRAISRHYMNKQYEPKLKINKEYYFSFWQFLKKAPYNNFGRFAIFIALINFTQMIAGPFFTPYMLRGLKLNYLTFTIINLVVSSIATLITMPLWGKFLDRYGCVKTMNITRWIIPIVPCLWLISPSVYWLAIVQIISGIGWAGFNLAAGTFTYHAVTKERMSLCVAYSSIFNGFGIFLGATLGGLITSLPIKFMNIYLFVFLVSGIARLIVITTIQPLIKEVEPVKEPESLFKLVLVKPLKGLNHILFGHVLGSLYPFSKFNHHNRR